MCAKKIYKLKEITKQVNQIQSLNLPKVLKQLIYQYWEQRPLYHLFKNEISSLSILNYLDNHIILNASLIEKFCYIGFIGKLQFISMEHIVNANYNGLDMIIDAHNEVFHILDIFGPKLKNIIINTAGFLTDFRLHDKLVYAYRSDKLSDIKPISILNGDFCDELEKILINENKIIESYLKKLNVVLRAALRNKSWFMKDRILQNKLFFIIDMHVEINFPAKFLLNNNAYSYINFTYFIDETLRSLKY